MSYRTSPKRALNKLRQMRILITSTGNVGLGTVTPKMKLHVTV